MATLDSSFERDLRDAVLDELEQHARSEIAPAVREHAHELLREYGDRHEYDVQSLIDASETRVERRGDRVVTRVGWPEPAIYFERGTVAHTVEATDASVLSFIWEEPPAWVREAYEPEGDGYRVFLPRVEVDGLPEARFIRDTLNWVNREVAG